MTTSKMVLMNGPMNIGKDVAIDNLARCGVVLGRRECKERVHKMTQEFFEISEHDYFEIYNNRKTKEMPMERFSVSDAAAVKLGIVPEFLKRVCVGETKIPLSIREAMIYVSEVVAKPTFGKDYFGKWRADNLGECGNYFDGSAGFEEELPPLIDEIGQENILLLRIHREGFEFGDNDSRNYIPDGVIDNTVDIQNIDLTTYLEDVRQVVEGFLRK